MSAREVLAFIDWVLGLLWRATLDLAPGDASWDEIAASLGVEPPKLAPGDVYTDELGTAQLYWPAVGPWTPTSLSPLIIYEAIRERAA